MALLVMKDKRLTRPLIIDYFDNSNLLTYEFRYEFCQTSVSLYFPPDFKLQGHQRRDEDGFALQRTSLTIILPPPPPPPPTALSLMACNFE